MISETACIDRSTSQRVNRAAMMLGMDKNRTKLEKSTSMTARFACAAILVVTALCHLACSSLVRPPPPPARPASPFTIEWDPITGKGAVIQVMPLSLIHI